MPMRNLMAIVLASVFAAVSGASNTNDIVQNYPPGAVSGWLKGWYDEQSPTVSMRITWIRKAEGEFLHCRIVNESGQSIVVDRNLLPWNAWPARDFVPFNAEGTALDLWRPGSFLSGEPEPLVLGAGQFIEGDIDFVGQPSYKLTLHEDLFLLWRATVSIYKKPTDSNSEDPLSAPRLFMSGMTFVPKHERPTK